MGISSLKDMRQDFVKKNLIYFIFAGVLVLIFISFFITEIFFNKAIKVSEPPFPTPGYPIPGHVYDTQTSEDIAKRDKSRLITQLLGKLPYKGNNFYLEYFYTNHQFRLTLYKGREQTGEDEFVNFLRDNNIPGEKDLDGLVITIMP